MPGPRVGVGWEGVGLADEARDPCADGDPRGQAVVVGEVERLLGRDAQPGAGVGVVADHRRVDGHRDPGGFFGVLRVAHPEQEAALQQVQDALADLLLVFGAGSELGEVLQAERDFQAGAAVGGDLVDDVLGAGDVVRLVDEQRDARPVGLGQVDLALHLGVQHAQHEVHARLAVVLPDRAHVGVDDQHVARLDDVAERDVGGVVEEAPQRRHAGQPATLLRGASRRWATALPAMRRSSGSSDAEERGGLVEVGLVGARLGDGVAEVLLHRQQQAVDVLELRAPLLALGERDRADHRVVEVAAAALEDLVLVDVQQRGDDVVGDRRRLDRQRPVAAEPQRAHPERRVPEVQEPDALATVGRREPQAQPAELALGVEDDDRRVGVPQRRLRTISASPRSYRSPCCRPAGRRTCGRRGG